MNLSKYIHRISTPKEIIFRKTLFLDTCFIIYMLEHNLESKLENFCKYHEVYTTSFNFKELKFVIKKLPEIKKQLKRLLERDILKIIFIPVTPGNKKQEIDYVNKTDIRILKIIEDPSDAVLVSAAIKSKSDIITRDKHHIFKVLLENELKEYNIQVFNNISSYEQNLTNDF